MEEFLRETLATDRQTLPSETHRRRCIEKRMYSHDDDIGILRRSGTKANKLFE